MSIAELKALFLQHQNQRTGRQLLMANTRKTLQAKKFSSFKLMGIDPSCIGTIGKKTTISAYHLALIGSDSNIVRRAGLYKPKC